MCPGQRCILSSAHLRRQCIPLPNQQRHCRVGWLLSNRNVFTGVHWFVWNLKKIPTHPGFPTADRYVMWQHPPVSSKLFKRIFEITGGKNIRSGKDSCFQNHTWDYTYFFKKKSLPCGAVLTLLHKCIYGLLVFTTHKKQPNSELKRGRWNSIIHPGFCSFRQKTALPKQVGT